MNKHKFIDLVKESNESSQTIKGIFNWCDRWCERCGQTKHCTVFMSTSHLPSGTQEEVFESLAMIFEATIDMLKEYAEENDIDIDAYENTEIEDDYEKMRETISNDSGVILARQYGVQVKQWLDSLEANNHFEIELIERDPMLSECLEVIQWYQHLIEVKMIRALMSKKDEERKQMDMYDSIGNAKLLLVSIKRNIGAWGYLLQKFKDDEDEILDILVCLQKLNKRIEQIFPEAQSFIRPGLD